MPLFGILLIAIAAVLLLTAIAGMALLKGAVRRQNRVRGPEEKSCGAGERRALLLYQPSNHGANVPLTMALAQAVAELGYTVTVNHPSEQLPYQPQDYDLLLFGTGVYMGQTAEPLKRYLAGHPVAGKPVLLYATGRMAEHPELDELVRLVAEGNTVSALKLRPDETERLLTFARTELH